MKSYIIPCDWQLALQDNWVAEYYRNTNESVFYPDDSQLTVRMTPFYLENDGKPVPAQEMEIMFLKTLMPGCKEMVIEHDTPEGYSSRVFKEVFEEDGIDITALYVGIFAESELLIVTIFGTSEQESLQALDILKTIKKTYA